MSLLSAHLEQISLSCQGIDSLPFPPAKIFTNALLSNHDITSLIRDTEAHERALFSVPAPPAPPASAPPASAPVNDTVAAHHHHRRQTVFTVAAGEVTTAPPAPSLSSAAGKAGLAATSRRHTAVAAVLGGDLHAQIARRGAPGGGTGSGTGDVDVEVLLRGAERLCDVYALPGAAERIAALRARCGHQAGTLAYYEARVAEQAARLEGMKGDGWRGDEDEDEEKEVEAQGGAGGRGDAMTDEDLRREEDEVKELERKKKELQERLKAMDKDLGGLLNL